MMIFELVSVVFWVGLFLLFWSIDKSLEKHRVRISVLEKQIELVGGVVFRAAEINEERRKQILADIVSEERKPDV